MKFFKFFFLLTIMVFAVFSISSSKNSYQFQSEKGTYMEMQNGKKISWADFNPNTDMFFLPELNGENFYFYDIPFLIGGIKTFAVESNGVIRIDNDSAFIIIDGAFTYLDSLDENSSITYSVEGNPGDYLIKTQWKNVKIRINTEPNFVNFQIWIYQKSGVVEIHYGESPVTNGSGFSTQNGPQVGMFFSRDDFTKCFEKQWITGSPTNMKVDSAANYSFLAMSGMPENGTVLRFTPRFKTTEVKENMQDINVSIFPNPSSDMLNITITEDLNSNNFRLIIYDLEGKKIREESISNNQTVIDLTGYRSGTYFYELYNSNKIIKKDKFIIR